MNDSLVEFTKPVMVALAKSGQCWGAACVFLWKIHFAHSINKELERQTFPLLYFFFYLGKIEMKSCLLPLQWLLFYFLIILISSFSLILFEGEIHRGFFLSRPNDPGTLNPPASDSKLVQVYLAAYSDFNPQLLLFFIKSDQAYISRNIHKSKRGNFILHDSFPNHSPILDTRKHYHIFDHFHKVCNEARWRLLNSAFLEGLMETPA